MRRSYARAGYFTTWQYTNKEGTKSHRIYYNDIDIATGNLICDGKIVGNIRKTNHHMAKVDRENNYMW